MCMCMGGACTVAVRANAALRGLSPAGRARARAQVMRWMEQCSYIAASRIGRSGHLLIGSVDSLFFASPTRVGDIMYISAQVPEP